MELLHRLTSLHAAASPAGLFASVQASQVESVSADQQFSRLLEDTENRYLYWIDQRDRVLHDIEAGLQNRPAEQCRASLAQMLDYFDALVAEDCEVASIIRRHFKRLEKRAKAISREEAKQAHKIGLRFFNIVTRQIEAFIDVSDNLRALDHHYAATADKVVLSEIAASQIESPQQLLNDFLL